MVIQQFGTVVGNIMDVDMVETAAGLCNFINMPNSQAFNINAGTSATSGTLDMVIDNCSFTNVGQSQFSSDGTGLTRFQFINNSFTAGNVAVVALGPNGLSALATGSSTMYGTINNNTITGNPGNLSGNVVQLRGTLTAADMNVQVSNNIISSGGVGVNISMRDSSANSDFNVFNNTITGISNNSFGGIFYEVRDNAGNSTHRATFDNNDVGSAASNVGGIAGIHMDIEDGETAFITVTNNTIYSNGGEGFLIDVDAGTPTCLDLTGNIVNAAANQSFDLDNAAGAGGLSIEGAGAAAVTPANILAANTDNDGGGAALEAGINYNNNTNCTVPSGPYL